MRGAEKEGLSSRVIEVQASIAILAGIETMSVALKATVYFIPRNPHVYKEAC